MKHLKLSENQGVLTVSLNRPEKRNAFMPEMIREITQTFEKAGKSNSLRAVLLTGEGKSFCAGGDLEWMKSSVKFTMAQNLKDAAELYGMFFAIRNCPAPVVGGVFGHCFGGGAGLAACCDIVAADLGTQFSFSEVKWGLVPAVISPFVVERAHNGKVREWFLTGQVFSAAEALAGGLVHFSGSAKEADLFLEETFKHILDSAPEAVRETKKLLQSYSKIDWINTRAKVIKLIAKRRVSVEGQKGLDAFLNKQNPQWSDQPYGSPAKI